MYKYSKSTNGFYHEQGSNFIPSDAVDITDERHLELINKMVDGSLKLYADDNGYPILVADNPLSIDQLREKMVLSAVDAWLRLSELGLFDKIDAKIMALPRSAPIRIMWEKSLEYHRLNPVLVDFLTAIGMKDLEIDNIFTVDTAIF